MDPGPDIIWVAHGSFTNIQEDDENYEAIVEYFEGKCEEKGGNVESTHVLAAEDGSTIALLFKCSSIDSARGLCDNTHYLSQMCPAKADYSNMFDRVVEVKVYSSEAMMADNSQPDLDQSKHSVHSDATPPHSLTVQEEKMAIVEIYEWPDDFNLAELSMHFTDKWSVGYNMNARESDDGSVFILEFTESDAQKILEEPDQLLDEEDPDSMIKLRPQKPVEPIRELLVVGENRMNGRMMKNYFKKRGAVEGVRELGNDKMKFVVKFVDAEVAEKLAQQEAIVISTAAKVHVELYDGGDEADQGADGLGDFQSRRSVSSSSFTPSMGSPAVSRSPSTTSVTSLDMSKQSFTRLVTDPAVSNSPFQPKFGSTPSSSFNSGAASPVTEPAEHTHVEIDLLPQENVPDMYTLLCLHLEYLFGEDIVITKLPQSYDPTRRLFRLDLKPDEINKLLGETQTLTEGDDNSILTIRPQTTGNVVDLKVVNNPRRVGLARNAIIKAFGEVSMFSSKLNVLKCGATGAVVKMETCAVSARIVGLKVHKLDNMIELEASFAVGHSYTDDDLQGDCSQTSANVVLVKCDLNSTVLRKLMKSKTKGTLTSELGDGQFLVEYETESAAKAVADQKELVSMGKKVQVSLYIPEDEADKGDDLVGEEELSDTETSANGNKHETQPEPTHVIVQASIAGSPREVFNKLKKHFAGMLQEDLTTPFEQSYDEVSQVYRFDLCASSIEELKASPHQLNRREKFSLSTASTGKMVVSRPHPPADKLSRTALKKLCGQLGCQFKTPHFHKLETLLELDSCSAAAKMVSIGTFEVVKGSTIAIKFPSADSDEDSDNSDFESASRDSTPVPKTAVSPPVASPRRSQTPSTDGRAPPPPVATEDFKMTTLRVSNLLDVDTETLFFWIKSLINVWPYSIQMSADEESAIVNIPADCDLDVGKLSQLPNSSDYYLRGERLTVTEMFPATHLQVISTNTRSPDAVIDTDTLESYFSNGRYTHVKDSEALRGVRQITTHDGRSVHVAHYQTVDDVKCVLRHSPYEFGKWRFEVAEYYPEIGLCNPNSRQVFSALPHKNKGEEERVPILHIININEDEVDLEMLQLLMSHRRRSDGGEIESWRVCKGNAPGSTSVQIVYKDPEVASRVYKSHMKNELVTKGVTLELELELPWLTDLHDEHKVRISEVNEELDPEKLKFYLSALSENVVTELFFNQDQTRAVAMFRHKLDYGELIDTHHLHTLKEFSQLKIQQEYKTKDLLVVGKLSKEDIELPLESRLENKFKREVEVRAEQYPDATDIWKVTTEPEALEFILHQKGCIPRCESISPYTEFLGLQATSGFHKKTQDLSNIISHQLMLHFLLNMPTGFQKLSAKVKSLGLQLAKDGTITMNQSTDKKSDRKLLKNWRKLKPTLEKFVDETFQIYSTESLTQQIFDRLKPELPKLFEGYAIASHTLSSSFSATSTGTKIEITGEKEAIRKLQGLLESSIQKFEQQIKEEKSITTVNVPNVLEHQMKYLQLVGFFEKMIAEHDLKSFTPDLGRSSVAIQGRPTKIDSVQKAMFELLPNITKSKVSMTKKSLFLTVFRNESAQQSIKNQFAIKNINAVWFLENKTISVYSDTKSKSQEAMDCIDSVVWESHYPAEGELDDLERDLLNSPIWKEKKSSLIKQNPPLELIEADDQRRLNIAGLTQVQASVIEEVKTFFILNVKRTANFDGELGRINFLWKFKGTIFSDLAKEHSVEIDGQEGQSRIAIKGAKHDIANCLNALKRKHGDLCKDVHSVDHQAMIQHIETDQEFLDQVGTKTRCLVVKHIEQTVAESMPDDSSGAIGERYTMTLPSGTTIDVRRDDITFLGSEAIVNAANGDLQHIGGLAKEVIKKGGSSIQKECANYFRSNGKLMEGEVFTSSAGNLKCKKIIHAVGPRWQGGRHNEERKLMSCIDLCMDEMNKYKLKSIAIPPLSTGIFEYPVEKAVKAIVEAVFDRESQGDPLPEIITFVDNQEASLKYFVQELQKRSSKLHISPAPDAVTSRGTASSSLNYRVLDDDLLVIMERVNVELRKGDIVETEDNVLVNSVGKEFNLSKGRVSKAISNKAGPQLQKACTALAPLDIGEVKETSGYGMDCKAILHCFCPVPYDGQDSIKTLKEIVGTCLTMAARKGHKSITFPALGTGNLRYPVALVSQAMIEAMIEFVERNPTSSIKSICIFIFDRDSDTIQGFTNEIQRLRTLAPIPTAAPRASHTRLSHTPVPKVPQRRTTMARSTSHSPLEVVGTRNVGNMAISILHGDIANHQADVFVNCTNDKLQTKDSVSTALLTAAGDSARNMVNKISTTRPLDGFWQTPAGSLNGSFIFHADVKSCKTSSGKLATLITNILEKCDQLDMESVAIPALPKAKETAKTLLHTLLSYHDSHPQSTLKRIDVIVRKRRKVGLFEYYLNKSLDKKDSWWTSIKKVMWSASDPAETGSAVDGEDSSDSDSDDEAFEDKPLLLDIIANSKADITKCKDELGSKLEKVLFTMIWSEKDNYEEDRISIAKLTALQVERLQKAALKLHVTLQVNQRTHDIRIVGLNKDVYAMSEQISRALRKMENQEHEVAQQTLLAKTVQWKYGDERGDWNDFNLLINKMLEEAFSNDPHLPFPCETSSGPLTFHFEKMEFTNVAGTVFKMQRVEVGKLLASVSFPSTWKEPTDSFVEFELVPATPEYKEVEENFMSTVGATDGRSVVSITRIQNPTLYQQYILLRKKVAKQLGKKEEEVERSPMWHGTSKESVEKIVKDKFDRALKGKNACVFGQGCYFATKSHISISDEYASADDSGDRFVIQARVVTGDYTKGDKEMKTTPYKDAAQSEQYDSVVNDVDKPTIFVVFRDASAYPDYIIRFK